MASKTKTIKSDITFQQYTTALKARGFKRIGEGAFASVYLHPGKRRVYKVGKLTDFSSGGNWAYLAFLKVVLRSKNNPWFPKIYSIKKFKTNRKDKMFSRDCDPFFVVSMERLEKIKGPHEKSAMLEGLVEYHKVFASIFKKSIVKKKLKQFTGAMKVLYDLEEQGHSLDIHNSNIMLRKCGQIVITDPVC